MRRTSLNFQNLDWFLLAIATALAVLGVIEIYSASSGHFAAGGQYRRQILWILLGLVVALVMSQIDYHIVVEQTPWLYVACVVALGALLATGRAVGGARRWLQFRGGYTFQVSEFAKLVIIMALAAYFGRKRSKAVTWGDLAKLAAVVGVPAVLVALEPDLGTSLTFFPIAASAVFLVGIRTRQVAVLSLAGVLCLPVAWHFLRPYQRERVLTFVHPAARDKQGSSYQVTQTKIAIGSGGLWGKGLGNGTQSRLGFIPVSHADTIFAALAEELGFLGILFVLLLYLALLLRLLDGAQMAGDRTGALILVGLTSVLFFQIAVNVGMLIGLVPMTGIPLPLMSQGGSSALLTFAGLGLALSVKRQRYVNQ